jgi:hypothetical protein
VPGWKQPGPEGLPQKPVGQAQVFPSQCSMTAGPPLPDETDPTAQALSGEVAQLFQFQVSVLGPRSLGPERTTVPWQFGSFFLNKLGLFALPVETARCRRPHAPAMAAEADLSAASAAAFRAVNRLTTKRPSAGPGAAMSGRPDCHGTVPA